MSSFQITLTPSKRAAGRFVSRVRRKIQKALAEEEKKSGIKQTDIARTIGVHRSVINREIRGEKDLTLSRVAELAMALGRIPSFELLEPSAVAGLGANTPAAHLSIFSSTSVTAMTISPELTGTRISARAS